MTDVKVPAQHRLLIDLCLRHLTPFFWMGPSFLLISRQGADAVLASLEERGARILGLEGFELAGEEIHPRIDLIFDADRLPGFPSPRDFIAVWPENVWIDVTVTIPTADRLRGHHSRAGIMKSSSVSINWDAYEIYDPGVPGPLNTILRVEARLAFDK